MELVAPDLRTLALVNGRGGALGLPPALAHVRAPRLRELTVVDPPGQLRFAPARARADGDEDDGEKGPPRFPRLERLNVLGCEGVLGLRRWTRMAPRLTHLRISHLREAVAEPALRDLAPFLGAGECAYCGCLSVDALLTCVGVRTGPAREDGLHFANLEVLMIQPSPEPAVGGPGVGFYMQHLAAFNRLHRASTWPWALVPPWRHPRSVYEEGDVALWDWLDRLDGGEGCWKVEEKWFFPRLTSGQCASAWMRTF